MGLDGRVGQQVPGDLLDRELVERFIAIEGVNDVISVRKNVLILVPMIAHSIGKSHHVQPRHRHALAELRQTQEPIHLPFVSIRGCVAQKGPHFLGRRRQTDQIQAYTAQQRAFVGLG